MYLKGGISMRKTLKRTLSLFLAVLLICTVLTVAPFSAGALNVTLMAIFVMQTIICSQKTMKLLPVITISE